MEDSSPSRPASSQNRSSTVRSRSSTRKQPSYDASALAINPSPLLTSSLHSRNSATTAQESAYLVYARRLQWTRLGLVLLIVATGTATVGCAGHVLHAYNVTHLGNQWSLALWPRNVDVRPTLAVLVPAALVVAVSLVYVVFSLIPTVSRDRSVPTALISLSPLAILAYARLQHGLCRIICHRRGPLPGRHPLPCSFCQSFGEPPTGLPSIMGLQILEWSVKIHVGCAFFADTRLRCQWHAHPGRVQEIVCGERS